MLPLCHLSYDCEVFPVNPPWLCQDLSSFRLWISYRVSLNPTHPIAMHHVHPIHSLRNSLMDFFPLQQFSIEKHRKELRHRAIHEHLQGLATFLALLTLRYLRPCFMPKMLMGFSSQSFVPDLKLEPLRVPLLPCRLFLICTNSKWESNRSKTRASKLWSLNQGVPRWKVLAFNNGLLLPQDYHL